MGVTRGNLKTIVKDSGRYHKMRWKVGSWPNGMKLSPKQHQNREVVEL
jgi:hypothetical protein